MPTDDWQSDVVFTHVMSLVLDEAAQRTVCHISEQMRAHGLPVIDQPAHITLTCVDRIEGITAEVAGDEWPRDVILNAACQLPNSQNVVSLCPHPPDAPPSIAANRADESLARPHRLLHERLAGTGVTTFNYYAPGRWHPHVTLGYGVPAERLDEAALLLQEWVPMRVGVDSLTLWQVGPDHYRSTTVMKL